MQKLLIAALMVLAVSHSAQAAAIHDKCAPTVELGVKHGFESSRGAYNSWDRDEDTEVSFKIKWKLGLGDVCAQANHSSVEKDRWRAEQDRAKAMREKIKICKDFTLTTAPHSIRTYCGDLLN